MLCMSTGCWEGTNFHQLRPLLQQPGWYCPRALHWNHPSSNCCWYIGFAGPLELRFDRSWGQEMVVHPIHRFVSYHETARSFFDIHQCFLVSSARGFVGRFLLLSFSQSLYVFFDPGLSWVIFVTSIMTFFSTVLAGDVVQISPGSLLLLFYVAFIVSSFPTLRKHDLVSDPVWLRISMRVIIRLIV